MSVALVRSDSFRFFVVGSCLVDIYMSCGYVHDIAAIQYADTTITDQLTITQVKLSCHTHIVVIM